MEQPLYVAVDVADDQDRQIVRSEPSLLRTFGAKPALSCPLFHPFGARHAESGVMPRSYWLGRIWLRPIGA